MANITLSVDDKVLVTVRRYAAENDSSVNALVREYLTRLAAQEDQAASARVRIRELSENSRMRVGQKTWSRNDLHDR